MDLEDEFCEAADIVQNSTTSNEPKESKNKIDEKTLLQLYGLYKVVTVGSCNESQPGIFNIKKRAKWSAWKQVSGLSSEAAMSQYIELVKSSFNWEPSLNPSIKGTIGMGNSVSSFAIPKEDEQIHDQHPAFSWAKDNNLKELKSWAETADNINLQDENGLTVLHWCVDRGHLDACKLLLSNGADSSLEDNDGSSCIEYAETCEHTEILKLLIQNIKSQ